MQDSLFIVLLYVDYHRFEACSYKRSLAFLELIKASCPGLIAIMADIKDFRFGASLNYWIDYSGQP